MIDKTKTTNDEHFSQQVIYFKGEAQALGYKTVVYCEDYEDRLFWSSLFQANSLFSFKWYSQSKENSKTSGKNQCLQFYPFADKEFIICIDTDYDKLLGKDFYKDNPFVFQTETYSIENHLCYPKHLLSTLERSTQISPIEIDFRLFFETISPPIFDLLILSVLSEEKNDNLLHRHHFTPLFSINEPEYSNKLVDIAAQIADNIANKVVELRDNYTQNERTEKQNQVQEMGIHSQNAYLYMRGHAIFEVLVLPLIQRYAVEYTHQRRDSLLSNWEKSNYQEHIKKHKIKNIIYSITQMQGYPEIERIHKKYNDYLGL